MELKILLKLEEQEQGDHLYLWGKKKKAVYWVQFSTRLCACARTLESGLKTCIWSRWLFDLNGHKEQRAKPSMHQSF